MREIATCSLSVSCTSPTNGITHSEMALSHHHTIPLLTSPY